PPSRAARALPPARPAAGAPESTRQRLAPRQRAIDQTNLAGALIDQADQHRPRAAAGADDHDGAGIGAPGGLRLTHALDIAEGVVILSHERSIGCDDDA